MTIVRGHMVLGDIFADLSACCGMFSEPHETLEVKINYSDCNVIVACDGNVVFQSGNFEKANEVFDSIAKKLKKYFSFGDQELNYFYLDIDLDGLAALTTKEYANVDIQETSENMKQQ